MLGTAARRWVTVLGMSFFAVTALGSSKLRERLGSGEGASLLSTTKSAYIGNWEAVGVSLRIGADGALNYERKNGAVKKTVAGKVKNFEGDDIIVNALVNITLKVDAPPAEEGGAWTMTVEGNKLTRVGDGSADLNDIDEQLEAHIVEKFGAKKGLASVHCPEIEPSRKLFDCDAKLTNGKTAKVSVSHEGRNNYTYTVHVMDLDAPRLARDLSEKISQQAKRKITVDCGSEATVFLPEGEPLTCTAIQGKKQGVVEVSIGDDSVSWKVTGL